MKKKDIRDRDRQLTLRRETLRALSTSDLAHVVGGVEQLPGRSKTGNCPV